ncbi:hypothetical protein TSUD_422790, partial [Trifolium subterraneum]
MFSHFFWGGCEENRKTSWIKWDSICLNKANGGLGVRRLKEFNFSLLGKWVWRCLEEKDSLWCKVLHAKYGQEGGRLRFGEGVGSHWWRSMNDVRVGAGLGDARWLLDNITRRVGDGCETRFWTDPWLLDSPLQRSFGRLFDLAVDKNISVADMFAAGWDLGGEAWKWRRRLYAWEEELVVECVARLANVVLQVGARDRWVWRLDSSQCYSVKSAYSFLTASDVNITASFDRLPTKANLRHRGIVEDAQMLCSSLCGKVEDSNH